MTPLRIFCLLTVASLAACGGQSFTEGDDGGSGGAEAGRGGTGSGGTGRGGSSAGEGSGGTGRAGTGQGGTGQAGTGQAGTGQAGTGQAGTGQAGTGQGGTGQAGTGQGGTVACCLAAPTCPPGERQVSSPKECAPGGTCHEVTVCCSTIVCTSDAPQCDALPTCDPGDTQVMGPCPPDDSCYTRSLCGTTISCLDVACDPATEHNRDYLFENCEAVDYDCTTASTQPFANDCGCGCEQDPTCPEHLGCYHPTTAEKAPPPSDAAPPATGGTGTGGIALPLCDPAEVLRCPFSEHY